MMRRAMTLIELMATMALGAVVIGGALQVLRPLQRMASVDTARGVRAEMACSQLRRDALGSIAMAGATGLTFTRPSTRATNAILWQVDKGQLLRNERPMLAVTTFTQTQEAGWLVVTLTPQGLPQRRLDLRP